MFCYNCGKEITITERISREEKCTNCRVLLHCCKNCKFFKETAYHQCREPQAEFVKDKESANFCSYFKPSERRYDINNKKAKEARKKLDELFRDSGESSE